MGEWTQQLFVYTVAKANGEPLRYTFSRPLRPPEEAYLRECAREGRWEEARVLEALVKVSAS